MGGGGGGGVEKYASVIYKDLLCVGELTRLYSSKKSHGFWNGKINSL